MAYSYTLTPKDIYGVEEPEIPKGYKVVGFRPPQLRELYRSNGSASVYIADDIDVTSMRGLPRLILEKLPEKRRMTWDIENCDGCRWCRLKLSNGEPCCYRTSPPRQIANVFVFPEWCPLPKAPQE